MTALLAVACGGEPPAPPPAPKVDVARPLALDVVEWDEYTGRLEAPERVEVRARVSGYLQSIHFDEGGLVEAGDLLFVIDPRPFDAALDAARADRERAQSQLALAKNDRDRAERLIRSRAISEEEFDRRVTSLRDAQAALQAAGAAVRQAELDVEFTRVRAPIAGRTSRYLVTEGNLINGGNAQSTLLTTVVSLDPIHCYFDADERAYLKYVRLDRTGRRPGSRETPNPVFLALADEEGFPHRGHMDFVDNELDSTTGTITGRAIFPNAQALLSPGMFGRVRLLGSGRYRALLLPDSAIGFDQSERFVFALVDGDAVERRAVKTGALIRGLRSVTAGVAEGDRIVLTGLQSLRPGMIVAPEQRTIEAADELISVDALFPNPPPAVEGPPLTAR